MGHKTEAEFVWGRACMDIDKGNCRTQQMLESITVRRLYVFKLYLCLSVQFYVCVPYAIQWPSYTASCSGEGNVFVADTFQRVFAHFWYPINNHLI